MVWRRLLLGLLLVGGCVDLTKPPRLDIIDRNGGNGGGGGRDSGSSGGTAGGDAGDAQPGNDMSTPDTIDWPVDGSMPVDVPLLATGQRCSQGGQCLTGFCADGFCCDGACEGLCQTCGRPGNEGACGPAPDGEDPRNQCEPQPVTGCGLNGMCDGQGACARYILGTECAPGSCTAATESAASTCDGAGVCRSGSTRSCAPGVCMGSSCATSCASQADCQNGFFCDLGKCVIRRGNGATCTMAFQCASGQCVDGFCCTTACTQACYACNVSGKAGTCSPVPSGQDPQNECPAQAPSTCGRAGACNGLGACRLHAAGVSCQSQTCTGHVETSGRSCNGSGVCQAPTVRDCAPYPCNGTACATSCTNTSQCLAGNYCSAGVCVAFGAAPVLHWKFDEASGSTALDASGNGNAGTYFGSTGSPTPSGMLPPLSIANSSSRAFVASSRHAVRLAPAPAIIQPSNNLTISVWFRTTQLDLGHDPPAASEAVTQNDNYFIRIRTNDVAFTRRGAGTYLSCFGTVTNHLDGQWHHAVGVLSPAGMKVYVDGIERCSNTRGEPVQYDKGPDLFVGRHPSSSDWDFDGNLDDVRIYNRALPADEVAALAAGF